LKIDTDSLCVTPSRVGRSNERGYLLRRSSAFVFALMVLAAINGSVARADELVANAIAKAANYIYSTDFIQESVPDTFSDDEMQVLAANPDALNLMIRDALGHQHSVGGAKLMAHFGLRENFDYLRHQMLKPGRTYGWEGTYSNDEERYYSDGQYVYHSEYLAAIEEPAGTPLHEAIDLTGRERQRIADLAAKPNHESHHWAIWISGRLGL
jgi:hypothetical protein